MPLISTLATVVALIGSGTFLYTAEGLPISPLWGLLVVLVGGLAPFQTGVAFVFLLPLFGNRPDSEQSIVLTMLGCWVQLGLGCAGLLKGRRDGLPLRLQFAAFYLFVSFLSLFPIAARDALQHLYSAQSELFNLPLISWNLREAFLAPEAHPLYSARSVLLTLLAVSFAFEMFSLARQSLGRRLTIGVTVLLSLVTSLLAGLLDYYGLIDLRSMRALDPVVNPGDVQVRLQSWFGHSGWFAEFVTLTMPFALLVLASPARRFLKIPLLILLMLLGEFVLILTFQRGGWLSYPLTLLCMWAAIYVSRQLDKDGASLMRALRLAALKITLSLPLTIALSFGILKLAGTNLDLQSYAVRFQNISKASDRSDFMKAGWMLGSLNPVLGLGSESFPIEYRREFGVGGAYAGELNLPLHGSAHNVYAQTFAGKGALGLFSLLLLVLYAIFTNLRTVFGKASAHERLLSLTAICSLASFLIYGMVQEVFYVQSLQYLFFLVFVVGGNTASQTATALRTWLFSLSSLLFGLHLWLSLSVLPHRSPNRDQRAFGCFSPELSPAGSHFSWCGPRARIWLPLQKRADQTVLETVVQAAPYRSSNHPTLQVRVCGLTLFESKFSPSQKVSLSLTALPGCSDRKEDAALVEFRTAATLVPALSDSKSSDRRVLAFRLLEP